MSKSPRLRMLGSRVRPIGPKLRQPANHSIDSDRPRGKAWMQTIARIKQRDPLCVECERQGKVSPTTQIDHRIPRHLGGSDDDANLRGLCDDCHKAKTAQEAADRAAGITTARAPRPPRDPVLA